MSFLSAFSFIIVMTISTSTFAKGYDEKKFRCWGFFQTDDTSQNPIRVDLEKTSYDPLFYSASVENFSLAADTFYAPDGINLLILNRDTKASSSSLVGWRNSGRKGAKIATINSYQYVDEQRTQVQINCMIDETN